MEWKQRAEYHLQQAIETHGDLMPQHHVQFAQAYATLAVVDALENITEDGIGVLVVNTNDIAHQVAAEMGD